MAALHGVTAAPPAQCRVLEVGCSEGANLIPMAYAMPQAAFTGLDLAGLPIARGQQRIGELGLGNIQLFQADLCEGSGPGEYDYIVAHGVYAWVPDPVRDALLALCGEHLAPNGVAFISYNALPGAYLRNIVRDALRCGSRQAQTPEEQVAAGMKLLELIVQSRPEGDAYRHLVEDHLGRMIKRLPGGTYHDEMNPAYEPVSVAQFAAHARQHGLAYLCEAELPTPLDPGMRPDVIEAVAEFAGDDTVQQEYALDFLRMRGFRETLLVRSGVPVASRLTTEPMARFRFSSAATAAPSSRPGARTYQLERGAEVNIDQPPVVALLDRLIAAAPRALDYAAASDSLTTSGLLPQQVPGLLVQMAIARLIELHVWEAPVAASLPDRPRASACARQEVRKRAHVANLWHKTVELNDPPVAALFSLLDGTRTRADLVGAMQAQFPSMDPATLEERIEPNLETFLRAALLEA
ncbi:MAG TPA: class I SAM-dependent methyltransferase [Acidobacteriaceae bacterium]